MEKQKNWPVIGHKNIIKFLQDSITLNKIGNAYIFFGQKHLGKSLVAKYFIKSLLCEKKNGFFCDNCISCKEFAHGIYADFYEVGLEEGKKNISIEQIRKVSSKIKNSSFSGNYKIVLIKNAHNLSLPAANSLLKVLEEPKGKMVFILISDNLQKIPLTVRSRSQIINFKPVDPSEILTFLPDKEARKEIAYSVNSRPGLAISYMRDISLFNDYKISVDDFLDIFDLTINQKLDYIENKINKQKIFIEKVKIADDILNIWLSIFRDLLLSMNFSLNQIENIFAIDKIKSLSNKYSIKKIIYCIDKINQAKKYLHNNANPQLILENLILSF
ncbi:MAG: AAA family ATPase [Xanthomonadaceae bacterium]|nr:AAA family ATPase [Rhodospirillaceae bacterium]NIA18226.1 AAA family ATPase [Xanthomonadaceae bacterium]